MAVTGGTEASVAECVVQQRMHACTLAQEVLTWGMLRACAQELPASRAQVDAVTRGTRAALPPPRQTAQLSSRAAPLADARTGLRCRPPVCPLQAGMLRRNAREQDEEGMQDGWQHAAVAHPKGCPFRQKRCMCHVPAAAPAGTRACGGLRTTQRSRTRGARRSPPCGSSLRRAGPCSSSSSSRSRPAQAHLSPSCSRACSSRHIGAAMRTAALGSAPRRRHPHSSRRRAAQTPWHALLKAPNQETTSSWEVVPLGAPAC
jgi:hypothetical protein